MFSYINGFRLCYSFALIQTEKRQTVAYMFYPKNCYLIKLGLFSFVLRAAGLWKGVVIQWRRVTVSLKTSLQRIKRTINYEKK